jgi:hypothetical protein
VRWIISPATSGSGDFTTAMIVVKPKQAGLDTNLLVTTDRRAYKGRPWLSSARGITNAIAGGWNVSGIVSAHSGFPLTPTTSFDNANTGAGAQRPDLVGEPVPSGFVQTRQSWFNTSAFAIARQYSYGNAGVGIVRSPGIRNLDFNLYR